MNARRLLLGLLLTYGGLVVFGSLYPWSGWTPPAAGHWEKFLAVSLPQASTADMVTNFLVYMPWGLLFMLSLGQRYRVFFAVGLTVLSGALLSVSLEYLQLYLPGRVASLLDIVLNLAGTLGGALLATGLRRETPAGQRLFGLRQRYVQPGALGNLGVLVLVLWMLSQLMPLVPSLDLANLRQGLKPLWYTWHQNLPFYWLSMSSYALGIAGLGLLSERFLHPDQHRALLFGSVIVITLLLKIPVVSRQLSLEAVVGTCLGLLLFGLLRRLSATMTLYAAACLILGAVVSEALWVNATTAGATSSDFHWVPFSQQLDHPLIGLMDISHGLWPFLALSYLALLSQPKHPLVICLGGGVGVLMLTFGLEWYQQYLPGRVADITDVLIALLAWFLPWSYPACWPHRQPLTRTGRA
jgi:VanZ family protein